MKTRTLNRTQIRTQIRTLVWPGLLGCFLAAYLLLQRPHGFSECHAPAYLLHHAEWDIQSLAVTETEQLKNVLSQRFYYLSSGSQAYVFVSEDGKYVIKFFRMNHLIPRMIHGFSPRKIAKRQRNLHLLFNAYKLCYEKFRKESGLLFIHLNPTQQMLKTSLIVQDRCKKEHLIDLDKVPFVIQERAEPLLHRLCRLQAERKFEEIRATKEAFLALVQQRIAAGITDLDDAIGTNFGFVGDRPIQIDVGRLCIGTQPAQEYQRIIEALDKL